ncbi:TetR/AcrR family transcriptional regulator [Yinghuangia seranimata]|uniref:TetR/AcrR family transcriptional regulator n=1 Tax=Yinghuangia seranimata TaxID=408067 RepID=UPI00248AD042|nr:TetR/AcrR family transcriptional regulator [Yinghuangia seranimata]MDI2128617.1 helix-turn-helix domain-containing protein [Yinghuangia seranimata]
MLGDTVEERAGAAIRGAETRDRIVAAATDCIRRWGIRRVSMNDVAQQAGVSRRTVYLHFADREALVLEVLTRISELTVAAVEPLVRSRPTLAEQVAEAAVHVHALGPAELQLGLGYRPGESEDATLLLAHSDRAMSAWQGFWRPLVDEARDRGEVRAGLDADRAAEWIMRVIISLVTVPARTFDPDDPDQVRAFVAEFIIRGFAP